MSAIRSGGAPWTRWALPAVAILTVATLAVAWPVPPADGNTPDRSMVRVERVLTIPGDGETEAHQGVSCGGLSPQDKKCQRTVTLHSTVFVRGILVDPGYTGTVVHRVSSNTANLVWRCQFVAAGTPVEDIQCEEPPGTGSFQVGQTAWLDGKTIDIDNDPQIGIGAWEVYFETK